MREAILSVHSGTQSSLALSIVLRDPGAVRRYFMSRIQNGGLLVETPQPLPMDAEVLLMVTLSDSQPRVPVIGRVVFVVPKDNRENRVPAVGIQFTGDKAGVLTRIQNILAEFPDQEVSVPVF